MRPRQPEPAVPESDPMDGPFVSVPHRLLLAAAGLGLSSEELVLLLQIIAARQVEGVDFLSAQSLGSRCGMASGRVTEVIGRLVSLGVLRIGLRYDDAGTEENFFDLSPLWRALWPRNDHAAEMASRTDPGDVVSLFEQEFGRPLSPFECEQIIHWLERDRHPEWMLVEALREAVLSNKYNIKYIDRILYNWQRHKVRSRQDLEAYRHSYRERSAARDEAAATDAPRKPKRPAPASPKRDERYAAFYELFPDA
ncbi:MAG: DnaD domain protein [Alicyclobacillus sp.]|nr:DnaD domain protein [Alicyclobacillus sp.]